MTLRSLLSFNLIAALTLNPLAPAFASPSRTKQMAEMEANFVLRQRVTFKDLVAAECADESGNLYDELLLHNSTHPLITLCAVHDYLKAVRSKTEAEANARRAQFEAQRAEAEARRAQAGATQNPQGDATSSPTAEGEADPSETPVQLPGDRRALVTVTEAEQTALPRTPVAEAPASSSAQPQASGQDVNLEMLLSEIAASITIALENHWNGEFNIVLWLLLEHYRTESGDRPALTVLFSQVIGQIGDEVKAAQARNRWVWFVTGMTVVAGLSAFHIGYRRIQDHLRGLQPPKDLPGSWTPAPGAPTASPAEAAAASSGSRAVAIRPGETVRDHISRALAPMSGAVRAENAANRSLDVQRTLFENIYNRGYQFVAGSPNRQLFFRSLGIGAVTAGVPIGAMAVFLGDKIDVENILRVYRAQILCSYHHEVIALQEAVRSQNRSAEQMTESRRLLRVLASEARQMKQADDWLVRFAPRSVNIATWSDHPPLRDVLAGADRCEVVSADTLVEQIAETDRLLAGSIARVQGQGAQPAAPAGGPNAPRQ